jgi:peptidyl-prolyl cis-trans isomerase NIMA-interacting 1
LLFLLLFFLLFLLFIHSVSSSSSKKRIGAIHILQKHSGSRRLASRLDESGESIKARTKEQARKTLEGLQAQLQAKAGDADAVKKLFMELARKYSDCSSGENGGQLGSFKRGEMQQAFEDVAFALAVDEMSSIVDTESGLHLILRVS